MNHNIKNLNKKLLTKEFPCDNIIFADAPKIKAPATRTLIIEQ